MPPKRTKSLKATKTNKKIEDEAETPLPTEKLKRTGKRAGKEDIEEPKPKRAKTESKQTVKKSEPKQAAKRTEPKQMVNKKDTDLQNIDFECEKENKEGKRHNLKISSWNVSGVRAVIKKNGLDYILKEDADICALQETKCDTDKLPEEIKLKGYYHYYLGSKKPGYCGVAIYSKEKPLSVKYGLGKSDFDIEGRLITAEYPKFFLLNAYVPNAGQKLVTLPKRLKWNEAFKTFVEELDKQKPVIICGDMNVAHQEIDLTNPKTNTKNAGFTKEERDGMTDFLATGYVDTFRALYPTKTGAYTFWSYFANARSKNIGWRLDYFIVSERIKNKICDNIIRSEVFGSDHCPIVLYVNL